MNFVVIEGVAGLMKGYEEQMVTGFGHRRRHFMTVMDRGEYVQQGGTKGKETHYIPVMVYAKVSDYVRDNITMGDYVIVRGVLKTYKDSAGKWKLYVHGLWVRKLGTAFRTEGVKYNKTETNDSRTEESSSQSLD